MRLNLKAYVRELRKTVDVMGYHPSNNSVYLSTVHLFSRAGDDVLMYCGEEPDQVKFRVGSGPKDKNGVEIYEGDIIYCDNRNEDNPPYAEVEWDADEGQWAYAKHEQTEHGLEVETGQLAYLLADYEFSKIIGNIYENPDLLNAA